MSDALDGWRGRFGRRRAPVPSAAEGAEPIGREDVAAARALAREASTPFGYRRPAQELLAPFGGTGSEPRRRATAALALVGIAADPPLADAEPFQFVQLRRAEAAVRAPAPAAVPIPAPAASADPAPAPAAPAPAAPVQPREPEPAAEPPAAEPPAVPPPTAESARPPAPDPPRVPRTQRIAARFAPTQPVTSDRRMRAGATGLLALVLLIVVVVAFKSLAGDGGERAAALPETTVPTTAAPKPPAATKPAATRTTERPATASSSRPAAVRLRIAPTEPAYICVADGAGRTLWEGMRTGPYEVRARKLVLRVGVATAKITVNGRTVPVTKAPGAFELTPGGIRALSGDAFVCGG